MARPRWLRSSELGSFSPAADDLNLSPQLVGKQVKMLEQHLGVSMLHRTTRRQSLTGNTMAAIGRHPSDATNSNRPNAVIW
ncbi:LysR family transcriptional regulator [Stenotrophomonas maltophilia]|uniref:helix-turn-helix domain-containing protein n=1 Tax=Stenotrophomonas maltophilia TaxID=40324 RepID=UPI002A97819D|nr:LysR family transcriptional regulator [Stenotrophomonas maltophilia]MCU1209196.1 LysR family transcriptional regulator [Stenotrophomonas maltophilia]HEL4826720.1 LysR family transcriptional regulator [Stenotrophomonas maltophilia]HEL5083527.1 LysR family transcriptional regulator [Stenotrophomonas maltophilia]